MAPSRTGWCPDKSGLAVASSLEEANRVLEEFLPRFNERFGVPAAQPGSAYREVPEELDMDGVLCVKELRRVAKAWWDVLDYI